MTAIINAVLVMKDHYIPDGIVLMEDGKIAQCGSTKDICMPDDCEVIDAQGFYVGPGLIDISHVGDVTESCDATDLLRHGVTGVFSLQDCNTQIREYVQLMNVYKAEEAMDSDWDWDSDGSGTLLTLDVACRNRIVHTGCSVCDAFCFASSHPAQLLGLSDCGEIKVGNVADFVIVDAWFGVKKTILQGELVALNV